jgi:hypothetical protein
VYVQLLGAGLLLWLLHPHCLPTFARCALPQKHLHGRVWAPCTQQLLLCFQQKVRPENHTCYIRCADAALLCTVLCAHACVFFGGKSIFPWAEVLMETRLQFQVENHLRRHNIERTSADQPCLHGIEPFSSEHTSQARNGNTYKRQRCHLPNILHFVLPASSLRCLPHLPRCECETEDPENKVIRSSETKTRFFYNWLTVRLNCLLLQIYLDPSHSVDRLRYHERTETRNSLCIHTLHTFAFHLPAMHG